MKPAADGLLIGKTDKNGGVGIKIKTPEGKIIAGGGEIIINEKSSTKHCEVLSEINKDGGGVEIPCDDQPTANKGKYDGGGNINKKINTMNLYYLNPGNLIKDNSGKEQCKIVGHTKDGIQIVAHSNLPTVSTDHVEWDFNTLLTLMDEGKISIEGRPYNKDDQAHNFLLRHEIAMIKLTGDIADGESNIQGLKNKHADAVGEHEAYKANAGATIAGMEAMAEGGNIPKGYNGKTHEKIWNGWTVNQRRHFLADHNFNPIELEFIGKEIYKARYDQLPVPIKSRLSSHITHCQYAGGGAVAKGGRVKEWLIEAEEDEKRYIVVQNKKPKKGDLVFTEEAGKRFVGKVIGKPGKMAGGGKIKKLVKKKDYWHARIQSPRGAKTCRVPEWATNVAHSVSDKARVTVCQKNGNWYPQKIMIRAKGVKKAEAREIAEKVAAKIVTPKAETGARISERIGSKEHYKKWVKDEGYVTSMASTVLEAYAESHRNLTKDQYYKLGKELGFEKSEFLKYPY